ncbi:MAG: hypothetical protein IJ079_08280 [Lachnospiraceae bacterium]|nr:hypothetical protein [Lachnospiraceae bacterium]
MNHQKRKDILTTLISYIFIIAVIGIVLYRFLGLYNVQISKYPMYHQAGDAVTGMVTVKSMMENGWIYDNPYLSAPGTAENYDAMTMEIFLNLLEKIIVTITGNWVLTYNLFYLMGYFLAGFTAFYTLQQLKIPEIIAAPSAVLYALLPYHQLRGVGHMYLGMYFMVPISVLFLYRLMSNDLLFQKGKKGYITIPNVLRVLALMIMSLTGVYYTFFTCFFLCVVILYSLLNKRNWKQIRQAFFSLLVVGGTIILTSLPNLIYWHNNGKSGAISKKGPEGAEIYALKIIQLILPRPNHRYVFFDKISHFYQVVFPLVNENSTASLGIFMSVGFIILCVALFMSKKLSEDSYIRIGSILNLAALLFGTTGGFAVIIAFFTGAIRCYNRFSVFIAMFSLIAIDSVIMLIWKKWFSQKKWKTVLTAIGMVGIMCCGIVDQIIPENPGNYDVYAAQYESDEAFVKAIESMEASGAMIYQLPYMKYPENGGINQMPDYSHMSAYLHSSSLRWSFGAAEGREVDDWQKSVDSLTMKEQLPIIKEAGFAGIYIDWRAYLPDEREALEQIFNEEISGDPILNADGTKAYYSFKE